MLDATVFPVHPRNGRVRRGPMIAPTFLHSRSGSRGVIISRGTRYGYTANYWFQIAQRNPSPPMEPFKIFEDDRVRVSATLVDHAPIWPAFGYRFDTDDGSIAFSGDTGRSENLIKLAKGADILVHEVIVTSFVNKLFPTPRTVGQEGLIRHLLDHHTRV